MNQTLSQKSGRLAFLLYTCNRIFYIEIAVISFFDTRAGCSK